MTLKANISYRLLHGAENPQADGRQKYDVRFLPWKIGDTFYCRVTEEGTFYLEAKRCAASTDQRLARRTYGQLYPSHPGFAQLVAALVEMSETLTDVLKAEYADAEEVLNYFVRVGVISLEQVREAIAVLHGE